MNAPIRTNVGRRRLLRRALGALGALSTAALAGCDRLTSTDWFSSVLDLGSAFSRRVHKVIVPRNALAEEFNEAYIWPEFRSNGTSNPDNPQYQWLATGSFRDWRLEVSGMVRQPTHFSLDELRAMRKQTQITRHDCVEGWSAIGKWGGVRLDRILAIVMPLPQARYVVFHCADPMEAGRTAYYYESIDMEDARHPQTILAYELNDKPLPIKNGAPLRLRVERQLGYKHAKYLMRIELVDRLDNIRGGRGGYWEDSTGYAWYAGI
ncbi:MAG: molybdopterin-binding protein [Burkholderiaceae bacterium]